MDYDFYYKIKNGKEHILCVSYDNEGNSKTITLNSLDRLVEYIKRNCQICSEVSFNDFKKNQVLYVLNKASDTIERDDPPIGYAGPYMLQKRLVRGK